ncbi:MAG: DUF1565 domain-containing protein [Spirochaetia bacterium]|nr:DUF1565 domain-containing protein [Spirochaetia bacterium]
MQNKIITFSVIASLVFFSTITCQNAPVAENLQLQDITDVDKVPPTVEALNFSEGMYLSKDMIISGTANDNTQIVKIEVQIDENGWQEITTAALWYHTLSVTGLTIGAHSFSVRVTDAAGLQASQTYSFFYQPVLYVSIATGDDTNSGDIEAPLKTISKAIELYVLRGIPEVRVAEGEYLNQGVNISKNVRLLGGYSADFQNRDKDLYKTVITNTYSENPVVRISGPEVTNDTILDGFTIFNGYGSSESRAIHVFSYAKPVIQNNIINGGTVTYSGNIFTIYIDSNAQPVIQNNSIHGYSNSGVNAIRCIGASNLIIRNNIILISAGIDATAITNVCSSSIIVNNLIRITAGVSAQGIFSGGLENIIANNIFDVTKVDGTNDGYGIFGAQGKAMIANNIFITSQPTCINPSSGNNCGDGTILDPSTAGGADALINSGNVPIVEGNITLDGTVGNDIYSLLVNPPKGYSMTNNYGPNTNGGGIYEGNDIILEVNECSTLNYFLAGEYIEYDNNDIPLQISAGGVDCTASTSFITFTPALPAASVHNKAVTLWGTNNTNLVEDYRLKPGSIAIDAGRDVSAYYPVNGIEIVDLDGNTLGYDDAASIDFDGSKNDIGPYEWYP